MINCYKLSYSCSKKRLNDLIHKGLEYEKEHNIKQPEKETLLVKKDQRIEELEKENEELKEEDVKLRKLLDINDIFDYNSMLDLLNDMNCKCWNDYREKIYNLEQENAELKQKLENAIVLPNINNIFYKLETDIFNKSWITKCKLLCFQVETNRDITIGYNEFFLSDNGGKEVLNEVSDNYEYFNPEFYFNTKAEAEEALRKLEVK